MKKENLSGQAHQKTPKKRDAEGTRQRILDAARTRFTKSSYDLVGLREIAADANVTATMISRYFGSKEGLFREVIADSFKLTQAGPVQLNKFSGAVARHFMSPDIFRFSSNGFDPTQLLLHSLMSPTAAPIMAKAYYEDFVKPLASLIGGDDAEIKATVISSYLIGLATLRVALGSPAFRARNMEKLTALVSKTIQDCL